MARAAVSGGLRARRAWRLGVLVDRWAETSTAYTLVFEVTDWPGHLAGQHVDLRLTAEDGYQTSRSYSLAGPAEGDRIEITVQRLDTGEVSPFLTDELSAGGELEVLVRAAAGSSGAPRTPDRSCSWAGGRASSLLRPWCGRGPASVGHRFGSSPRFAHPRTGSMRRS